MFDYEIIAGQGYMKDSRLKSFEWTDTGIKLTILHTHKNLDLGKYEGEVVIGSDYRKSTIEISEILGKSFIYLDYVKIVGMQSQSPTQQVKHTPSSKCLFNILLQHINVNK